MKKYIIPICVIVAIAASGTTVYRFKNDNPIEHKNPSLAAYSINLDSGNNTDSEETQESTSISKEELYNKMLNTVDYYDTVRGEIIYSSSYALDEATDMKFESDLNRSIAKTNHLSVSISNPQEVLETGRLDYSDIGMSNINYICDGKTIIKFNETKGTYDSIYGSPVTREESVPVPAEERFELDDDVPCFTYRLNPTNLYGVNICVLPQEYAYSYLMDFDKWEISGYETVLDRKCAIISGITKEEFRSKSNSYTFKIDVDCETGTILRFIGFDENDNMTWYMAAQNIEFNVPIDDVVMPSTNGYTPLEEYRKRS